MAKKKRAPRVRTRHPGVFKEGDNKLWIQVSKRDRSGRRIYRGRYLDDVPLEQAVLARAQMLVELAAEVKQGPCQKRSVPERRAPLRSGRPYVQSSSNR